MLPARLIAQTVVSAVLVLPAAAPATASAWHLTRTATITVPASFSSGGPNQFGYRVEISGDGSTIVAGENGWKVHRALVFARTPSGWACQAVLQGPANYSIGHKSMALSRDGSVAVIGAENGAVVFTRAAGIWTQASVLGSAWMEADATVGVSDTGTRAFVRDRVYDRQGAGWSSGTTLVGRNPFGAGAFGSAGASSGDGQTVVIAGPASTESSGTLWTFAPAGGGTWPQIGEPAAVPSEHLALTPDGQTLLAAGGRRGSGAAILRRTASGWTMQADLDAMLAGRSTTAAGGVAISDAADFAVSGAGENAVRLFARDSSGWHLQPGRVIEALDDGDVAMTGDGSTAIFGDPHAADGVGHPDVGAVHVYTLQPGDLPEDPRDGFSSESRPAGTSGQAGSQPEPASAAQGASGGAGTGAVAQITAAQVRRMLGPGRLRARDALARRGLTFSASAPAAGTLTVRWTSAGKHATVLARGTRTFTAAGPGQVNVKLTRVGRTTITRHRKAKITVRGTFIPTGGTSPVTSSKPATVVP